jgi:inorganic pyrophosphatase
MARIDQREIPPISDISSVLNAIVEFPKRRPRKFELDKDTGLIKLDWHVLSSAICPGDCGLIPQSPAKVINDVRYSVDLFHMQWAHHEPGWHRQES